MQLRLPLRIWFAILLTTAFHGELGAQAGTITGLVRSAETGAPLIAAYVQVTGPDGDRIAATITGQTGRYLVNTVPVGSYTVTVNTTGYATMRAEGVSVAAGQTAVADFDLSPRAIDLDPISVTASRREERALDAPARVEVVSPVEIAETPTLQPVDHLRDLAGVDIVTQGLQSTNVVARGFNNVFSGALLALTDHRIAAIPSLRVNSLHLIPATNDDIERMEVVLGPGSALYGPNTANGVLHIFTRSPLTHQGSTISLTGGQRSVFQGTARTSQLIGENFGMKVSGEYFRGEEWEYADPVEVAARADALPGDPNTRIGLRDFDSERWAFDARADWRISPDATAIFSLGRSTYINGVELTGIGASQVRDWAYGYYQARFNWNRLFAQAYLNTSNAGSTYLLRDGAPSIDNSRFVVAQVQHGATPRVWQNFVYGVDYLNTMPDTEGTIHGRYEDEDEYTEVGAFIQSETTLTRQLELVLAGRVDRHSVVGKNVFSPRAALVFKPAETQTFRASYNRAYSNPGSVQLFLDLNAGPIEGTLGSLGYNVRAQGTGSRGIRFSDDNGDAFMRSPFGPTPGTLQMINTANVWEMQVRSFAAALVAGGQIAADQAPLFIQAMLAETPDIGVHGLNPLTQATSPFSVPADIPDVRESNNTTWELGYTGLFGGNVLLGADLWYSQRDNFISPLIPRGGFVLLNPQELAPYVQPKLNALLQLTGMPADEADATSQVMAAGMASLPGGVVSSPDFDLSSSDLLVSYQNFGDINLWGTDLSAQVLFGKWNARLSGSFVSDNYFETEGQIITLNASNRKVNASFGYRDEDMGFNGEVRLRYNSEFPVNSGAFIGLQCVSDAYSSTAPCVEAYTLADLTLGYKLPGIRGASVQFSVQNLLDSGYRSFVGAPEIGRMALLRLRYEF